MWRTAYLLGLALWGCDGFDPAGTYRGSANVTTTVRTMVTDLQPDGTFDADTRQGTSTEQGALVRVRRLDDRRLELTLVSSRCRLELRHGQEPNDRHAVVHPPMDQRCRLSFGNWEGPVAIQGTVDFSKDTPAVRIALQGAYRSTDNEDRAGHVTTTWSYDYQGTRPD